MDNTANCVGHEKEYLNFLKYFEGLGTGSLPTGKHFVTFFEGIVKTIVGQDFGKFAGFLFTKPEEMTEDDAANREFYDKVRALYCKRVPPTVDWKFDSDGPSFMDTDNVTRTYTCPRTIRFIWEKARVDEIPVSVKVWFGEKAPKDRAILRLGEKGPKIKSIPRLDEMINLRTWMLGNDSPSDMQRIAAIMRSRHIVDLNDTRSIKLGARMFLRIREVLSGLAADVLRQEKDILAVATVQRDLVRLRRRKPYTEDDGSGRWSGRDNLFDYERVEKRTKAWWEKPIEEMTRDEFLSLTEEKTKKELAQRYKRDRGTPAKDLGHVARKYREEWNDVMGQESRYLAILKEVEVRNFHGWDEYHRDQVRDADKKGRYRTAIENGRLSAERLFEVLADYPEIGGSYQHLPKRKQGLPAQSAPGEEMRAWEVAQKLGLGEEGLKERYCSPYDDAFRDRNVKTLADMLAPSRKLMRAIFEHQTGLTLPKDETETKKALEKWAGQ